MKGSATVLGQFTKRRPDIQECLRSIGSQRLLLIDNCLDSDFQINHLCQILVNRSHPSFAYIFLIFFWIFLTCINALRDLM